MTPLNVYDNGAVPPDAVIVTVAVPPKHVIADVTEADPVIAAGSGIFMVPATGLQLLASVMLQIYPVPAVTPLNIPVVFVTPLKVYDKGAVPPPPVNVTTPVPPKHFTGDVTDAEPVITARMVWNNSA